MTQFIFILVFLFSLVSAARAQEALSPSSGVVTLQQCYQWALQKNEDLLIRQQRVAQMEQQVQKARSAIFPSVSFNFSEFLQDTSGSDSGSGANSSLTRSEKPEGKFTIEQPIFSGFQDRYTAQSIRSAKEQAQLLEERFRKTLYLDVAQGYFYVLELEADWLNVQSVLKITKDRIAELEHRAKLGKSRASEVLSVEAQWALQRAEEEHIKGNLSVARESLSFLTGMDLGSAKLAGALPAAPWAELDENFLQKAYARSDILALQKRVESLRNLMQVARGGFYPALKFTGNYYVKRVGVQEPIDWDALFNLKLPLYEGGSTLADVRLAAAALREAELDLIRAKRAARSEIKSRWLNLKSAIMQTQVLEDAAQKAQKSFDLQSEEYRYGLVNNLEVLQSIAALENIRRSFDASRIRSVLEWIRLQMAAEQLP